MTSCTELRLATSKVAFRLGDSHALAGPSTDEVKLKLGEVGQDVEEHLAHRVLRVVDRPAKRQGNTTFGQIVSDGPGVGHGSGEAVQLWDDKRVALPHGCQRLVETRTLPVGPSEALIEIDLRLYSEVLEGLVLCCEILLIRRATRIANHHHLATVSHSGPSVVHSTGRGY